MPGAISWKPILRRTAARTRSSRPRQSSRPIPALLKLNQKTKLEAALAKAAASGDRFSSGAAFTLRGDIVMQEGGESADAAKKALADGYLRVVLMYTDQPVAAKLRPEALYKAAQCFEKLGQSGRAEAMRGELKKLYPNTLWAMK